MDHVEVWKLQDDMMPTLMDPREFSSSIDQSHFSSDEQFDSSFSSSSSYFNGYYTPSRSDSFGTSEFGGPVSSRATIVSNEVDSPIEESTFYTLASIHHAAKKEADNENSFFAAPYHRSIQDHNMMIENSSQVDNMYGSLELRQTFDGLPDMIFEDLPELMLHDIASPIPMISSHNNFVIPSQTFISEPYYPMTPKNKPRAILGSPLKERSQSEEMIKYFMSPRDTQLHTPSSSTSSGSPSVRTPSSQTLKTSVALHCIQSTGGSRVNRKLKRLPNVTFNRDHVEGVESVEKGKHKCPHPRCKSAPGFKRHEHLKRHLRTHLGERPFPCQFCKTRFDRSDNCKQHIRRHADPGCTRTTFVPEAKQLVESWDKKEKKDEMDIKLEVPNMADRENRAYKRKARARSSVKAEPW